MTGAFGPYELVGALGRGGMGSVFEVRHPGLPGRRLALKLARVARENPISLRRFEREAELLARVRHPGIVTVHATGRSPEGPWLVMDLVEGRTLEQHLEARGPLPPAEAADLTARLADAVGALHAAGVVHRDLKPANVLLDPQGNPVVIDLGLARAADVERLTHSGTLAGSPLYMAPEQVDGTSPERLDARVDVWALGAILYALLCGRSPFEDSRSLVEAMQRICSEEPRWPEAPPALVVVLRRALGKRAEQRHPDAAALAAALRGLDLGPLARRSWALLALPALALLAFGVALLRLPPAPAGGGASAGASAVIASASPASVARQPWRRLTFPRALRAGAAFLPQGRLLVWTRGVIGSELSEWRLPASGPLQATGRRWSLEKGQILEIAVGARGTAVLWNGRDLLRLDTALPEAQLQRLSLGGLERSMERLAISPQGDLLAVGEGRSQNAQVAVFRLDGAEAVRLLSHALDPGAGTDHLLVDREGLVVCSSGRAGDSTCPLELVALPGGEVRRRVDSGFGVHALLRVEGGALWVGNDKHMLQRLRPGATQLEQSLRGVDLVEPGSFFAGRAHSGSPTAIRRAGPDLLVTCSRGPSPEELDQARGRSKAAELRLWARGAGEAWTNAGGVLRWPGPLRTLDVSPDGEWVVVGHDAAVEVWAVESIPRLEPGSERLPRWEDATRTFSSPGE